MTCSNSPEISFQVMKDGETYLEIRPRSMQFDRTRGSFDYCKAEFSKEVADHIQPALNDETSYLRQPAPVFIILNGKPVYRMLWVPDGVRFAENAVHIELHDPQKVLSRGVVDWKRENVKLKEAYKYVFKQRDTAGTDIFNGIKFTVPENAYEELDAYRTGFFEFDKLLDRKTSDLIGERRGEDGAPLLYHQNDVIKDIEEENVYNIIDGHYAIDFDKISPWECILELNEKFGVTTWAAPNGNLYVGERNATGGQHIATPDDRRAWKLTDYNINPPRDPVIKSIIRGGWADDPSESHAENIFYEIETLNHGTEDFRVEGVAETKTESLHGQEIFEEHIEAKRDNLEEIAKRKMINKQRQQNSGYLEILPEISGTEFSEVAHAAIGDSIITIPPDSDSDSGSVCDTNIQPEIFYITGVQHELTKNSSWNLRLDVVKKLDNELSPDNISTSTRFYDPSSKENISTDKYSANSDDS